MLNQDKSAPSRKKLPYQRGIGNQVDIIQTESVKNGPRVNQLVNQPPSATDPNGSYTGRPMNENDTPVQDADDL